jgi:hypothetical protein
MYRIIGFGILLFLIEGHALRVENPQDIEFQVRLLKAPHVYHMGEPIEVEISYSTRTEKKYYGSFTAPRPDLIGVTPHVTPMDGVFDLRELRRDRGMAGSILSGVGYVSPQPLTQQFDLCEWYRFRKPGQYSVVVTSTEVSRVRNAEEGGGLEPLTLESDPLDFDILPADPVWDAEQINKIEQELNTTANAGERWQALRRLALLDTPASVRLLVKVYLANNDGGEDSILDPALHESSHANAIIPLLTEALSDPAANIPQSLPWLLADLQTRRKLGVMPAYPSDPAGRKKWTEERKARSRVRDKYIAEANALLTASIEKRSGTQRAAAIYQVWYDATQLKAAGTLTPAAQSELQSQVLAVAGALDQARRLQFVILAWQTMPHEQLHPQIRKLAQDSINHPAGNGIYDAVELWCMGWPEECNAAILQAVLKTHAKIDKNVILMMAEAEHPELDRMLEAQLRDPAMLTDAFQSQRMAAVVLRAGSRNLVPAVDYFLDQMAGKGRCDGETEGELLGYLFRVAPKDGEKRLAAMLEGKNGSCGTEALRSLQQVQVHPSKDIIHIVTQALNSQNLGVEWVAALYLGDYGPASSEEALWRRLEELWQAWRGRASELQIPMPDTGADTRNRTVLLERSLASALVHGKNWKLTPTERQRLRSGCLTQPCRDIADGKLFLNL